MKRLVSGASSFSLNNDPASQSLACSSAEASAGRFEDRAAELERFKRKYKEGGRRVEIKYDWRREGVELAEAGKRAEAVVRSAKAAFEKLAKGKELEGEGGGEREGEMREEYKARFRELAAIMAVLKAPSPPSSSSTLPPPPSQLAALSSLKPLYAELLLRSREALAAERSSLLSEHCAAAGEAREAREAVARSLREGESEERGVRLTAAVEGMFAEAGFEGSVEMSLLKEEARERAGEAGRERERGVEEARGGEGEGEGEIEEGGRDNETACEASEPSSSSSSSSSSSPSASSASSSSLSSEMVANKTAVVFNKTVLEWERKAKKGGVKKLLERLKAELPTHSAASFKIMLARRASGALARTKFAEVEAQYGRKIAAITSWAAKAIAALSSALAKRAERDYMAGVSEAMREEQHATLRLLRAEREARGREEEEASERNARREREAEREEKERWDKDHEEAKQEVEKYKEEQKAKGALQERLDAIQKDAEESSRQARMEVNEERVVYRGIVMQEKMRAAAHELELKAIAEREKVERLSALAATAPYWDNVVNAKADLDKTTKAREADVYREDLTGLYSFQQGDGKLRSFTNEKVFSDVRFRLGAALHAAGVNHTAASAAMVRQLIPRQPERTTGIGQRNPLLG